MKHLLFLSLFLFPLYSCASENDPIDRKGNGGNDHSLAFVTMAKQAVDELEVMAMPEAQADHIAKLRSALTSASVLVTSDTLTIRRNGVDQECVAINDPSTMTIKLSPKWSDIADHRVRRAIALHEFEGLIGVETTGNYRVSALYLSRSGYNGDPLSALASRAFSYSPKFWKCWELVDLYGNKENGNKPIYSGAIPSIKSFLNKDGVEQLDLKIWNRLTGFSHTERMYKKNDLWLSENYRFNEEKDNLGFADLRMTYGPYSTFCESVPGLKD